MNSVEWLSRLISFDTTSRFSNLPMIEDIRAFIDQYGFITRLSHDPYEKKANLFVTIPGSDDEVKGGLILSGHTDVVPVDGQQWDSDPFVMTQRDGKLFGRGACDMKGFIAVTLALVPEFSKMKLTKPIHFAFSYDEEIGCRGAPVMIDDLKRANITADACIVGEPTDMYPVMAHKGIQVHRCYFQGRAAHSSLTPHGCNAIDYAAEMICYLRQLSADLKMQGPFDNDFDVPFTSLSTNTIKGGIAHNTIPAECEFTFEFRHLPSVNAAQLNAKIKKYIDAELLPKMQREFSGAKIELDNIAVAPAFESSSHSDILKRARTLLNDQQHRKVAYATEAGLFQHASIPTIVCGPGNIEQAHRANEFVTIEQLHQCEDFLRKIVADFCL